MAGKNYLPASARAEGQPPLVANRQEFPVGSVVESPDCTWSPGIATPGLGLARLRRNRRGLERRHPRERKLAAVLRAELAFRHELNCDCSPSIVVPDGSMSL